MKRTLLVLCLGLFVAVAASGCACNSWVLAPFGPGTVCDSSGGGCGSCDSCGPTCTPACDDCGGGCGTAPCEPCGTACPPCGPLSGLFALLAEGYCGPSCGKVWWGDWHGAPPDCCDPCNRCGEYTGGGHAGHVIGGHEGHVVGVHEGHACKSCGGHPGGSTPVSGYAGRASQVDKARIVAMRTNGNAGGPSVVSKPAGGQIAGKSTKFAPRLISISDKVVDADPNQPGSVPQATLPQRMPAHR